MQRANPSSAQLRLYSDLKQMQTEPPPVRRLLVQEMQRRGTYTPIGN